MPQVNSISTTMANLLAKNDSVSYDMHVAAFQTMLAKLEATNTLVLANENATVMLANSIRNDYAALEELVAAADEGLFVCLFSKILFDES